jgi:hypothetical protein
MQWSVCLRITLVVLLMRRWQQVHWLLVVLQSWHVRLLLLLLLLMVLQLLVGLLLPVCRTLRRRIKHLLTERRVPLDASGPLRLLG